MNNTCRIILSTECIFDCEYCCNKIESVQNSFRMSTIRQIVDKNYEVYNLTGGEVALCQDKLTDTINAIKSRTLLNKIYVYTTGWAISDLMKIWGIDGFSIGIHFENPKMSIDACKVLNDYDISNRALILDNWRDWNIKDSIKNEIENLKNRVELQLNDCDNANEDRYII
jgi:sulfatase maturation enzyme AslB (radical SAM superfamily)